MPKISKREAKLYDQAMKLVRNTRSLDYEEKLFVIKNYNPMAEHITGVTGTFFTPPTFAREMCIEMSSDPNKKVLDLCAGIGTLAFISKNFFRISDENFTCIENNPDYIEVGKKILPGANWIRADAFDEITYTSLGRFDEVISNPPYGLSPKNSWLHKSKSHYMATEIAMHVSDHAIFVLLQSHVPFAFSGVQFFRHIQNKEYEKFNKKTGVILSPNCGIDTTSIDCTWKGLSNKMIFEIVIVSKEKK